MSTLIKNCTIVPDDKTLFKGSVLVEDGKIKAFYHDGSELPETDGIIEGDGQYLIPGMIDIHLHGSYGYDFIRDPQTSIDIVSKGLVQEGTTAFMASLTVVSHDELCALLDEYRMAAPRRAARVALGQLRHGRNDLLLFFCQDFFPQFGHFKYLVLPMCIANKVDLNEGICLTRIEYL